MPATSHSPTLGAPAVLHRPVFRPAAVLAVAVAVGVLSSCSGDSDSPSRGAADSTAQQPETSTSEGSDAESGLPSAEDGALSASLVDFAVELPEQELAAGSYTIEVTNDGSASHDLVIEDADGSEVAASEVMPPGQSGTVEVDLVAGEYDFYCSVGNHRGMGMELAVTVV